MTHIRAAVLALAISVTLCVQRGVAGDPKDQEKGPPASAERTADIILKGTPRELVGVASRVAQLDAPQLRTLFEVLRAKAAALAEQPERKSGRGAADGKGRARTAWERERTRQLIARLADDNPKIMLEVVEELGFFQDPSAARALSDMYGASASVDLRKGLMWSLEMMRAVDAIPTLISALSDDDLWVRLGADNAIVRITGQDHDYIRWWIEEGNSAPAQEFYRDWFRKNEATLRKNLNQPKRSDSKGATGGPTATAELALVQLASQILRPSEPEHDSVAASVVGLKRRAVLQLLMALREQTHAGPGASSKPELVYRLPSEQDHDSRLRLWASRLMLEKTELACHATTRIQQLGDLRAAKYLVGAIERTLGDSDFSVRACAIVSLKVLKAVDGVPVLIEMLDDIEAYKGVVRDPAYVALVEITGKRIPYDSQGSKSSRQGTQRRYRTWFKANERRLRKKLGQERK